MAMREQDTGWSCTPLTRSCRRQGTRAVVTLSIGTRPFIQITRPLMEVYASKVGADLHVVDSLDHISLRKYKDQLADKLRFMKLPLLEHFLGRYWQVLYLDDDALVGPRTPDLFAAVPCGEIGAVVERHKPQNWHAMHWRSTCELYNLPGCEPKHWWLYNSGLLVLSQRHRPLVEGWQQKKLTCRVLCDQLYLNGAARTNGFCVRDLGAAFNYVGSELRRALIKPPSRTRLSALRDACVAHLTRKVPKLYTADWLVQRALRRDDALHCARNASEPRRGWRGELLAKLPSLGHKYDIGKEMCSGQAEGCALQPWVTANASFAGT